MRATPPHPQRVFMQQRRPQRVALQVQRLGAVCFRGAGVADQHVS